MAAEIAETAIEVGTTVVVIGALAGLHDLLQEKILHRIVTDPYHPRQQHRKDGGTAPTVGAEVTAEVVMTGALVTGGEIKMIDTKMIDVTEEIDVVEVGLHRWCSPL